MRKKKTPEELAAEAEAEDEDDFTSESLFCIKIFGLFRNLKKSKNCSQTGLTLLNLNAIEIHPLVNYF